MNILAQKIKNSRPIVLSDEIWTDVIPEEAWSGLELSSNREAYCTGEYILSQSLEHNSCLVLFWASGSHLQFFQPAHCLSHWWSFLKEWCGGHSLRSSVRVVPWGFQMQWWRKLFAQVLWIFFFNHWKDIQYYIKRSIVKSEWGKPARSPEPLSFIPYTAIVSTVFQVVLCLQHGERHDTFVFCHERCMCIDNWYTLLPREICKQTLLSAYLISIPFVFLDFNYKNNEFSLKKKKLDFPEVCAGWSVK